MSNPNCPFCGAKDIYKCGSWGIDAQETRNPLCREREAHNNTKRERDEAIRQLENLKASAIHSCHDQCQRPMCVLRRERDEAKKTAVMLAGELAAARRDLILAKREAK